LDATAYSAVTVQGIVSVQIPVDATAITHDPGDVLAEDGLPQHEPEAEAAITVQGLDHGETAALAAPITMPLRCSPTPAC